MLTRKLRQGNESELHEMSRRARELAQLGRSLRNSGKERGYVLSEEQPGKDVPSIWFWYVPSKYELLHRQRQQAALF